MQRFSAVVVVALLVAAASVSRASADTATGSAATANARPLQRCATENALRTVNGAQQRCTRNPKGVLRWRAATATVTKAVDNPKLLQVEPRGDSAGVGSLAYTPDGVLIAGGTFWYGATLGNFTVETEAKGPNAPFGGTNLTGFFATVSPDFEWTSARQIGGTSAGEAGFDVILPLSDSSVVVAGQFRGRLNIGNTTYRATPNNAKDSATTRDMSGYSPTAYFGRILSDGSWAWHRTLPFAGGSRITFAHELVDGPLFLSGTYNATPDYAPKSGYSSTDAHFMLVYDRNGTLLNSRLIQTTANVDGSWIDLRVNSLLPDGSVIVSGTYCGSLSFGGVSLPKSGLPRTSRNGRIGPLCDGPSYFLGKSGFVAKLRPDLAVEWLVDLEPKGPQQNSLDLRVHGAAVSLKGDVTIVGRLTGGEFRFGNSLLKVRPDAGPRSLPEQIGFVAAIDAAGKLRWGKSAGNRVSLVRATPDDKFVIGGSYGRPGATLDAYSLITFGEFDGFVAKIDGVGKWEWLNGISFPGPRNKEWNSGVHSLAVAPDGSIAVGGYIEGNVQFGTAPVAGRAQISTGFVARLSPDGVWK